MKIKASGFDSYELALIIEDTPHFMSEILKNLLRVAVLFETIHHEGAAKGQKETKPHQQCVVVFTYSNQLIRNQPVAAENF